MTMPQPPQFLPEAPTDLLSDVLRSLRVSGAIFLRGQFTEPWGVSAPTAADMATLLKPGAGRTLIFHIVFEGPCWINLESGESSRLRAPGIIFMPHGHSHLLADQAGRTHKPVADMLPPLPWTEFPVLDHGGGGERTKIICGYLHFSNFVFAPLLAELPNLIAFELSDRTEAGSLQPILEYISQEAGEARPGSASLVFRLAELFFAEVLRRHGKSLANGDAGWFTALNDRHLGRALQLLHENPDHDWRVEELANAVATSRSTLASRFKEKLGYGPIQYLSKWRIQLAARQLAETDIAISELAARVGFASESAFYRAFYRETGVSPGAWRSQAR